MINDVYIVVLLVTLDEVHDWEITYKRFPQARYNEEFVAQLVPSDGSCFFSALKIFRIKSYLRSSMNQERLNHAMVAVIHGEHLDNIDLMKLITEFILRNEERRATFKLPK